MSFEDNGDSLASEGLFTPFFVSLHIFPLPLPRLLLPHDFPGIFYADFDVAVGGVLLLSIDNKVFICDNAKLNNCKT